MTQFDFWICVMGFRGIVSQNLLQLNVHHEVLTLKSLHRVPTQSPNLIVAHLGIVSYF